MSWKSVRCIAAVSVIGLTWLTPSAVEAQQSGLFSAGRSRISTVGFAHTRLARRHNVAQPGGDDGLGPAAARPGDCGCAPPFARSEQSRISA